MTTSTSTVLSQDLVMTDTIPVDSTSPAPTAVLCQGSCRISGFESDHTVGSG